MDNDSIDASLGLAFSLTVFRQYRAHGILRAIVRHIPGVKGTVTAYLQLKDGVVVACYVENSSGQRVSLYPELLVQVDDERGPFEWTFHPQQTHPAVPGDQGGASVPPFYDPSLQFENPPPTTSYPRPGFQMSPLGQSGFLHDGAIPVIVNVLALERLEDWTLQQKQSFLAVLRAIDGKRSIRDIKIILQLPPEFVEEALRLLLTWNTIALSS